MKSISTVFFDAGHTFLSPRESVGEIYSRLGKEIGYVFLPEILNARISAAWGKYLRMKSLRNFQCTNDLLIRDWRQFVYDVLSPKIQADDFEKIFRHIYRRLGDPEFYMLAGGFTDAITILKKMNIRVGLVSNWDNRLPKLLKAFNLYSLFDTLTISFEAGFEKPSTKIFSIACERTNVLPGNALMIGDSVNGDIEAPASMGMAGILYDPKKLKTDWRGPILRSWKEPDILFAFVKEE